MKITCISASNIGPAHAHSVSTRTCELVGDILPDRAGSGGPGSARAAGQERAGCARRMIRGSQVPGNAGGSVDVQFSQPSVIVIVSFRYRHPKHPLAPAGGAEIARGTHLKSAFEGGSWSPRTQFFLLRKTGFPWLHLSRQDPDLSCMIYCQG